MVWAVLILLGVPLWLCAAGIFTVVFRNRQLRRRDGNLEVRVLRAGHERWRRGHAIWVSDVFAWRGSPATYAEVLTQVTAAHGRSPTADESAKLHRLGTELAVVELSGSAGGRLTVATAGANRPALLGPFAADPATTP